MRAKEVHYGTEINGLHWVFVSHETQRPQRLPYLHKLLQGYNTKNPQQTINTCEKGEDYIYCFDTKEQEANQQDPKELKDLPAFKHIEGLENYTTYKVSTKENERHIKINKGGVVDDETQPPKRLSSSKRKAQSAEKKQPRKQPRINQVLCSQFVARLLPLI